ncbi:hypothetical protein RJ640_029530 [Escallonia rubra]|uniref:Integrase catalytic domain-containing protein n=1 Tax=Escallonia rubra TaxID=112253 RepID=A0AA88RND3_9ASTE|nr:hypothetical protein RJ640_029530 [Escallonia rubra]
MELIHFSHEHPLILTEEQKSDGEEVHVRHMELRAAFVMFVDSLGNGSPTTVPSAALTSTYYVHVKCAASEKELLRDEKPEILDPNLMHFPMLEESDDLVNVVLLGNKELAEDLNHFSHDHALKLFDSQASFSTKAVPSYPESWYTNFTQSICSTSRCLLILLTSSTATCVVDLVTDSRLDIEVACSTLTSDVLAYLAKSSMNLTSTPLSSAQIVEICWRTLLARGKSSATHCFLCAIKGHRVSGGIRAAVAQGTVASAKRIVWDSLLRKTMANTKERIDALEAQIQSMFKCDQDAPGILKQFSLRLDALEVNLEATDNARYAESMDWEGKFQELHDRVEHHTRHTEVDRLFFFVEGLKPWARTELNRHRVNNLNEAIIATESLSDYNSEPQRPPQRGNPSRSNGGKKPGGQAPNQSWGSKSSWASNSSTQQKSGVGFKAKPDASTNGEVKKPAFRGCFLCQGPHVIANCLQRQMMNAFFDNMGHVQHGEQSGSQSRHPPTVEQTDVQDYEEEDVVGAFPQWCNAVTTQVGNPEESSTGEKPKDMPLKKKSDVPGKGLMYVDIKVNGKAIRAMVDTGATHNYISSTEVERLGLTLEKGYIRVKAINSAAQPVAGIARSVLIKIGPYEGRTNFSVVIMDDFKLILGLEFLRDTKTTVMPCTNSLAMLGSKPCVIPTVSPRAGKCSISALQWQELLAEFNFILEYRAGSTNSVADALSRRAKLDQVASMAMNAIVRADSRVAINIGKKIRKALTRDPVAQQLLKLIESGKTRQFWQEDGLLMTKGRWVYVPRVDDLRRTLIRECHDTLWAGHVGGERKLALLQQGYYWPQMGDEVQEYVKTCLTYQQDKVEHKKKARLLQPLSIAKRPWESMSLDFITGLPKVEDLGTILVVVDRFSNDRDSRFTGNFWTELFKLFGSQLSMSSSYHPESDGQTKRFNSMLEEYLRHFVSATQKNWVKLLDVAQLCFNSHKSSSTGNSAFEIVNGQQPLLPHTVNVPNAGKSSRAISFSEEWRQNIDLAHSYLEKAARRMKKHADKNRRSQEFNVGDKVMVKLLPQDRKFLRGRDSRLLQKYEGPLTIVKKIGKMAYKVDPPNWWSR